MIENNPVNDEGLFRTRLKKLLLIRLLLTIFLLLLTIAAQAGMKEDIFRSRTFSLCSSCYFCTLRCPRGLPLTETMAALKRMAFREGLFTDRKSPAFYGAFLKTVRKHGRVRETEMMARYFNSLKDPAAPLSFTPLAIKLLLKGKIGFQLPGFGRAKLDGLFRKVKELEKAE